MTLQSIEYTLEALITFLTTTDDNLVVVMLGDHQPHHYVSGPDADRDVPVTVLARGREVLTSIASWHWQRGLRPSPQAPVWRMDAFRDRFLTAFSTPRRVRGEPTAARNRVWGRGPSVVPIGAAQGVRRDRRQR